MAVFLNAVHTLLIGAEANKVNDNIKKLIQQFKYECKLIRKAAENGCVYQKGVEILLI